MNSRRAKIIFTVGLAFATAFVGSRALAEQVAIGGTHSKDEIKNACNAVGGDLLGVSDSGSYGCENSNKGTLVLCNKDGKCTGWVPAKTPAARNRVATAFGLKVKPVAEAQCCTGVDIGAKCVAEPASGGCPADHPIRVIKP